MNIRRYRTIQRERSRALAKKIGRFSVGGRKFVPVLTPYRHATMEGWGWDDGGSSTPPIHPTLAKLRDLALAAPATVAEFDHADGVTPVLGDANENPRIVNELAEPNYQRHWVSGNGKNNGDGGTDNPRLTEVALCFNVANWGFMYGDPGITVNFNDGSQAQARAAYAGFGSSRPYIGIRTNSRYLSIAGQHAAMFRLQVNGVFWKYHQIIGNNRYLNYDFGDSTFRNIVISGQSDVCFFSDICIQTGATIEPYDFMAERGGLVVGVEGDSYTGYNDDIVSNMSFMEMWTYMIGGAAVVEGARGSTGYQRNAGETGWAVVEPERLSFIEAQPLDVLLEQVGINDDIPRDSINPGGTNPDIDTLDAIETALVARRAAHPDAVMIVQGPWAPNQVFAQQEGSKYRAIMTKIIEVMQVLGGPWIVLDNIFGSWYTSWGTQRPTLRGAWQTGTGNEGAPNGTGNGDTCVNPDGTHPSVPIGITTYSQIGTSEIRMALATLPA